MADAINSQQMARKQVNRRNKSTTSIGSKKSQRLSSSTTPPNKFLPNIDGFNAFINAIKKLGQHGVEFTWHDLRKVYHKETARNLTAEEMNAIFGTKNMTKRELFDMPRIKGFLTSMDGTLHCRFKLAATPTQLTVLQERNTQNNIVPHCEGNSSSTQSLAGSQSRSIDESPEPIEILTDCDAKVGPTSDYSKSEACDDMVPQKHSSLSHQNSMQSSLTDDEGWVSGKENRSANSSPLIDEVIVDDEDMGKKSAELEDDVFANDQRIAAGSDQCDGGVLASMMVENENFASSPVDRPSSPLLVTESVEAAFAAVVESFESTSVAVPVLVKEEATLYATTSQLKSQLSVNGEEKVTKENVVESYESAAPTAPIRKLIEKFDTPVNFTENKTKEETPMLKTIYSKVLEEIGDKAEKKENNGFSPLKKELGDEDSTNVIFRSTSTHSSIIAQGKEQLAEFVAEQEAKEKEVENQTDAAFTLKEQSSLSSMDQDYFNSRMVKNNDLFDELGVNDTDGFQLKSQTESAITAEKSVSNDSGLTSEGLVTVIEKTSKSAETTIKDSIRDRANSIESEGDIPYSLCSEDEGEPMTMIENTMKAASHSAEQLSKPKDEAKAKTVVVNVDLDATNNREASVDVNTSLKDRIAALQSAAAGKSVPAPMASGDSVDVDEEGVRVLNRTHEMETTILSIKPPTAATNQDGSARVGRRHVRFMRGCCTVQ